MFYWECTRRLALLRKFRVLAFDYFQNIQPAGWMAGGAPPIMNDEAQQSRHEINGIVEDVVLSLNLLRIPHVVAYQPVRPSEYAQTVDVIGNIFALYQFQISSQVVFDSTDRGIGVYERECRKLLRKCFNPFYWLQMLVVWFLRLPFKLLGAAGFNASKVEDSLFGKLLKLALGLATFIAAVVEIADHWGMIRVFLQECVAVLHRLWA